MPGYTLDQITRVPYVMGVVSEYNAPGSTISRYYGLGLTSRPGQVLPRRTGLYDIYNPTRGLPVQRLAMQPPARVARKPIGQKVITTSRFYESLGMAYEEIWKNRPVGGRYGEVDPMGMSYVMMQMKHELQKFQNAHEFMAVQMFRGGWSVLQSGEDLLPVPLGTAGAIFDVETLMEADQKDQLAINPGGTDVIDGSWDDPATDIVQQFFNLDKVHAVRHGAPIRHVWANSTTISPLFNNTSLRSIAGDAFTLFETMTRRTIDPGQRFPDTGYDIVFRAMPNITFHVYNQVYIAGQVSEGRVAQTDFDNISYYIPDNEAIFTPEPGTWCELIHGSEPVQFNRNETVRSASGFAVGRNWDIEPPRVELKFLNNAAPVLVEPRATYNPTVIFV